MKVRRPSYSIMDYLSDRYAELHFPLAFRATTREGWREWHSALMAKLRELLGEFPPPCELNARVLETTQCDGYTRQKVEYESTPGVLVPAYVLLPDGLQGRTRALLCLHGHGNGKSDVVGMEVTTVPSQIQHYNVMSPSGPWIRELRYDYAVQFARRGYITIAPDFWGFGERRHGYDFGLKRDGCNVNFLKAILLGINLLTLNIWDALRTLDYLASRPEVDPDRIGCVGLSFGATMTMYTAILDQRIKAAVISCYLTTFRAYALDLSNFCGSQFAPFFLKYAELPDLAALIAPQPVLFENGTLDPGFPIRVTREAYRQVRRVYEVLGCPERVDIDEFRGGHRFSGRKAFDWLDRWI